MLKENLSNEAEVFFGRYEILYPLGILNIYIVLYICELFPSTGTLRLTTSYSRLL